MKDNCLEFGCKFLGLKITVKPTVRDKNTGKAELGKKIVFERGKCVLSTKEDKDSIAMLANRDDFENDRPAPANIWPLDADAYNAYAKKEGLPKVDRTGRVAVLVTESADTLKVIADKDERIKALESELKAMQDTANPEGAKKGK